MSERTALVNDLKVIAISFSSAIQIGDCTERTASVRQVAIQKYPDITGEEDEAYGDYPFFTREAPYYPLPTNQVLRTVNHQPHIHVERIKLTGLSGSSQIQIGNCQSIYADTKIKHIRYV
ncbi:Protein of unknown function [Amphibacillus marinus]|uniref:Spore germination protein PE n=1 Tax=Amphibacillus marinus TaxID=872970 RepID=A0A1H8Q6P9_9BACI|nr:spore germination protein GerPE [Amphibacillus marinus]SEO49909.1 Protein of unknown function [Amphibacillus marinus]